MSANNVVNDAYAAWMLEPTNETLYNTLYRHVLSYANSIASRIIESENGFRREDIASDSASYAMLNIRRFRGECKFTSWVYKTVQCDVLNAIESLAAERQWGEIADMPSQQTVDPFSDYRGVLDQIPGLTLQESSLLKAIRADISMAEWSKQNGVKRSSASTYMLRIAQKARTTETYSNIVSAFK